MGYQVLSRKLRPRNFSQVIGQEHVCLALKNALKTKKIGHAYLFTGTRGVGKTTLVRVFSKALCCHNLDANFNPCLQCEPCLSIENGNNPDVIEIDGASHNGVEHMRMVIDNVQYLPAHGKYKVYIIDEVHMLSISAFNALLKTLEEPPRHIIFLLATTAPEKLLGTVLSRVQRLDFRHVSEQLLFEHLGRILEDENFLTESDYCLRQIAKMAAGSVRDAMSLLEQALIFGQDNKLTIDSIQLAFGLVKLELIQKLGVAILEGNSIEVSKNFQSVLNECLDLKLFCLSFLDFFYQAILNFGSNSHSAQCGDLKLSSYSKIELMWIYEILCKDFEWALSSLMPEKTLEIILQKVALRRSFFNDPKHEILALESNEGNESNEGEQSNIELQVKKESTTMNVQTSTKQEVQKLRQDLSWDSFLVFLQKKSRALAANLEQGNLLRDPEVGINYLKLEIGFLPSAQVFLDYLGDKIILDKLSGLASEFFLVNKENINITLSTVKESNEGSEFVSKSELHERALAEEKQRKENVILNNSFILEAKKLFNSEVDQVLIHEQ